MWQHEQQGGQHCAPRHADAGPVGSSGPPGGRLGPDRRRTTGASRQVTTSNL